MIDGTRPNDTAARADRARRLGITPAPCAPDTPAEIAMRLVWRSLDAVAWLLRLICGIAERLTGGRWRWLRWFEMFASLVWHPVGSDADGHAIYCEIAAAWDVACILEGK